LGVVDGESDAVSTGRGCPAKITEQQKAPESILLDPADPDFEERLRAYNGN
jgi:hypothetical protein